MNKYQELALTQFWAPDLQLSTGHISSNCADTSTGQNKLYHSSLHSWASLSFTKLTTLAPLSTYSVIILCHSSLLPTRLPGCCFYHLQTPHADCFLQSHVLSFSAIIWLFVAPWAVVRQAPLSLELSRQEYWSGLPFPSPGDLPNLAIKTASLASPALAGGSPSSLHLVTWTYCGKGCDLRQAFHLLSSVSQPPVIRQSHVTCCDYMKMTLMTFTPKHPKEPLYNLFFS